MSHQVKSENTRCFKITGVATVEQRNFQVVQNYRQTGKESGYRNQNPLKLRVVEIQKVSQSFTERFTFFWAIFSNIYGIPEKITE